MIEEGGKCFIGGAAESARKLCFYKSRVFGKECIKDGCPKIVCSSGTDTMGSYQKTVCADTGDERAEYF